MIKFHFINPVNRLLYLIQNLGVKPFLSNSDYVRNIIDFILVDFD